jgi:modulator of FtsH protease
MHPYSSAEWESLFLAEAGASAALAGLLFVALSINLERILKGAGLPGRAGEAIVLLLTVLVVSTWVLVPGQSPTVLGAELLGSGLFAWLILVAVQATGNLNAVVKRQQGLVLGSGHGREGEPRSR